MTLLVSAEVLSGLDKSFDVCLPCWAVSPMRLGMSFVCLQCTSSAWLISIVFWHVWLSLPVCWPLFLDFFFFLFRKTF